MSMFYECPICLQRGDCDCIIPIEKRAYEPTKKDKERFIEYINYMSDKTIKLKEIENDPMP